MEHGYEKSASTPPRPAMVDCMGTDPGDLTAWAMRVDAMIAMVVGEPTIATDPTRFGREDVEAEPLGSAIWGAQSDDTCVTRTVYGPEQEGSGEPFAYWRMMFHPSFLSFGVEIPIRRTDGDTAAMTRLAADPTGELRTLASVLRGEAAARLACTTTALRPEKDAAAAASEFCRTESERLAPHFDGRTSRAMVSTCTATPWTRAIVRVEERTDGRMGRREIAYEALRTNEDEIRHPSPICVSLVEFDLDGDRVLRAMGTGTAYRKPLMPEDVMERLRMKAEAAAGPKLRIARRLHAHETWRDLDLDGGAA